MAPIRFRRLQNNALFITVLSNISKLRDGPCGNQAGPMIWAAL